ncbi:MAG: TIGR01777 family oxidoreductase [Planctomycetota bacterium]|nr:TIGR01777 family oxidoreductase [Planctomycetota bacterium]
MKIAITGGTGFVGTRLVPKLLDAGHEVTVLVRNEKKAEEVLPGGVTIIKYDLYDVESVKAGIEGAEAVINMAGANLFSKRWSGRYMKEIRDSRVVGTRTLVEAMGELETPPKVLLSASAVGWYGPRDPEAVCREDEYDATVFAPRDYLAHVCREWESAARKAELLGMRVVRLRLGVVIGRGEGALKAMELPFKMGAGGPVGNGKQMFSWIHVDDVCGMIQWAMENDEVSGPLNVTGPNPVSNKEFAKAFGRALSRPAFLPTPVIGLRVLLGKVATVVASGQRVPPLKAEALGYPFQYHTIDEALQAEYAKQDAGEAVPA